MQGSWTELGSVMATLYFLRTIANQFIPPALYSYLERKICEMVGFLSPYRSLYIEETHGFKESELFGSVQQYLSEGCTKEAKNLVIKKPKNSRFFSFTIYNHEQITDDFQGAKLWWTLQNREHDSRLFRAAHVNKMFVLTFHKKHKDLVIGSYLPHIVTHAKITEANKREKYIYTNSNDEDRKFGSHGKAWIPVPFEHPSTFETIALEEALRAEILQDLDTFRDGESFYKRTGRAWKRGYLLHGPPGTGKSSLIAAIANYMDYDIYDLELTHVKTNSELRKLLINTTNRSVVVIEDIDCSLDLSRKAKKKRDDDDCKHSEKKLGRKDSSDDRESQVTLSGVLNFVDGLWSSCGSERVFVFTTNHVERLDRALLRPGRMDKHIHLSFCGFGAFKVLAKNYLGVERHALFGDVEGLIEAAQMTPADVAEVLMTNIHDPTSAMSSLVKAMCLKNEQGKANEPSQQEGKELMEINS